MSLFVKESVGLSFCVKSVAGSWLTRPGLRVGWSAYSELDVRAHVSAAGVTLERFPAGSS